MSQLKKAAILSYVNILLRNSIGIFLTPFIVKMLGKGEYGLYSLIGSFIAYLTILDLGLNTSVIRYVAQYRTQKDKLGEQNFIANIFIVYFSLTILIAFFGFILYLNTNFFFSESLNIEELNKAKIMVLILIFNVMVTIPGKALEGVSMGYERFVFPRALAIVKYLSRAILVVGILTMGYDSLGLVILDTILNIIFTSIMLYYIFNRLKVRPKLHSFKLDFIKEIFGYSIWVFVFALVFQFKWSTGQVVLGVNTSSETVAIFAVGITLGMYFNAFGNVINGLLLPKVVKNVYEGISVENQVNQLIKVSRLVLFVLSFILLAFLLFGQEFIQLWLGYGFEESWFVALLFMIAYTMPITQGYIHKMLEAKKMLKFKSLSFLVFGVLGIILGAILSKEYTIKGMIFGIVFFEILLQVFLNFYYQRALNIPIVFYLKKTFLKYIVYSSVIFVFISLIKKYYIEVSWLSFLLQAVLYSILYFGGVYIFIFTNQEKDMVLKILKFKKNK